MHKPRTFAPALPLSLALVGCLLLAGCRPGPDVKGAEYFTFREPVQIDTTRLRLDGYYYRVWFEDHPGLIRPGMQMQPLILWTDGTVAMPNAWFDGFASDSAHHPPGDEWLDVAHAQFMENWRPNGDSAKTGLRGASWGHFRLDGDRITVQMILPIYSSPPPWSFYGPLHYHGIVLSDTSFVIYESYNPAADFRRPNDRTHVYHFRPVEEKPPPLSHWTLTHPDLQ